MDAPSPKTDEEGRRRARRRWALAVEDPQPLQATPRAWRAAAHAATIGIFIIMFFAVLNVARPVMLPVTAAFVVMMMLSPLAQQADRHRVPSLVTTLVLWALVIVVFYGLIVQISAPVVAWVDKAPEIGRNLQEKLQVLERPLEGLRNMRDALLPDGEAKGVGVDIMSLVSPAVSIVTPALGQLFIFFGVLFFMLLGRNRARRVLVAFFQEREARLRTLRIMRDIEHNLTGYLTVVTVINLGVGVAAGILAFAVGLPDPVAWGVLGFVLNYVPYVGALIMELAMFMVGLVTFATLGHALLAPALYVAVNVLEGQFITPSALGRKFTLNPLTVFLSLVFWSWLWGPVGAFLAVPLLVMALVVVVHLFPKDAPELPD
jgi:predicted PurR-regulated permease PerM